VDVAPDHPNNREYPYFVRFDFQNIEETDDKEIGKEMRTNEELAAKYPEDKKDEKSSADYDGDGAVIPAEQETMNQESSEQKKEASENNETIITCELMNDVNDGLKKPVVIIPEFWGLNIRKIGVMWDNAVLKEISTAGEVVPQVSIIRDNGPSYKKIAQDQTKQT
jgi:hypothetical protein